MKVINRKKFIVRIIEIVIVIATIVLTLVSINYANKIRGHIAYGGEYLIPVFGLLLILVLETNLEERK